MSDFKQAVQWLKEGKKVRRENWSVKNLYCKYSESVWSGNNFKEGIFFFKDNSKNTIKEEFTFKDFEATDWEIYEEKDFNERNMGEEFGLIFCDNQGEVKNYIKICEGKHVQQVAYSSYHDALTQVCFGCKRIRTSLKKEEVQR